MPALLRHDATLFDGRYLVNVDLHLLLLVLLVSLVYHTKQPSCTEYRAICLLRAGLLRTTAEFWRLPYDRAMLRNAVGSDEDDPDAEAPLSRSDPAIWLYQLLQRYVIEWRKAARLEIEYEVWIAMRVEIHSLVRAHRSAIEKRPHKDSVALLLRLWILKSCWHLGRISVTVYFE